MQRLLFLLFFAFALLCGAPALADPIGVTKTVATVSDPLGNFFPRALPRAVVEYKIVLANPGTNAGLPVRNMVFEDQLPANVKLRVTDLGLAGSGPVSFTDGEVILGIGASGLTYAFGGLGSTTDGIDFYDGTTWSYTPVPDADGCDASVRAIRIKPVTTFKTGGSFTLRFRAQIQ
jgi:uncharacterized repeat protein (TIGR01451 family)